MRKFNHDRSKTELDGDLVSELKKVGDKLDLSDLSDGTEIEPSLEPQEPSSLRLVDKPKISAEINAQNQSLDQPDQLRALGPGGGDQIDQSALDLEPEFDQEPALTAGPGPLDLGGADLDDRDLYDKDLGLDEEVASGPALGQEDLDLVPKAQSPARPRAGGAGRKAKKITKANSGPAPKLPGLSRPRRGGGIMFRLFKWAFWTATSLILFGLLVIFLCYAYFSQGLPSVDGLRNYKPKTVTFFYAQDGQIIGEYSHERRIVKPLSAMPESLKQAYLATEDANFYQHGGVNPVAIVRAAYKTIFEDHIQGGSTITQQLVRSFLLSNERRIERKIKEMILAFRVESVLNKDQIFELYLNQIYLGQGAYGVEAAALTYFDKHVEQLSVAESAMLAGITQSPTGKNPVTRPDEARRRQLYALSRMQAVGFLTPQQAKAAEEEIINVVGERVNPNTTVAPYFTEHVRRLLAEKYGEDSLYNDGWKVYTTLKVKDQEAADLAVAQGLWEYARRRGFRGPVLKLGDWTEIEAFRAQVDKKLGKAGLVPNHLYQAVILELGESNSLKVAVGSYQGQISKKNLEWILPKGALAKQLTAGDVVWVRLAPPPQASPEAEGALDKQAILASIASGAGGPELNFILEQRTDVQAALLSMDLADGGVRAMVGGRDFTESQFNRATQSQRQPGSSFKPIVYTAAMDNGFTPGSIMIDGPVVIDDLGSQKRWKPLNSDQKFLGPMPLYNALVASRNLVSVKVLERIGFEALDKTALDLGIKTALPHSPTVALGAHGVTMPEMITAYSSFPNLGLRVEPRYITKIEDRNGQVVETFDPTFYRAISPGTACVLTSMLRGVVAQGTGTSV
ncbi:MAG: transglycosylase domain-containing protein, partial [Deltaproteobacteria bacterium]|nr:transglycosylase domain-containing protein [Deltaproteobacteria bacterium]